MLDKIAPGTKIQVTIVKRPTSARATKTLVRLLRKDAAAKAEDRRQTKVRRDNFRQKIRGGRFWDTHVVPQPIVHALPGERGTITASLDVLTDLKSVERFVEVKPA